MEMARKNVAQSFCKRFHPFQKLNWKLPKLETTSTILSPIFSYLIGEGEMCNRFAIMGLRAEFSRLFIWGHTSVSVSLHMLRRFSQPLSSEETPQKSNTKHIYSPL